jgi:enamine deaminase RidA (YjgF/YER057c/UK114 family)
MPAHLRSVPVWIVTLFAVNSATPQITARGAEENIRFVDPSDSDGSSAAVVVPDEPLVHTAQFLPLDEEGGVIGMGRADQQINAVLAHLESAVRLVDPGAKPTIVKLNVVAANLAVADEVRRMLVSLKPAQSRPAVSYVIGKLRRPDVLVGIDGVAVSPKTAARGFVTYDPKKPATAAVLGPGAKVYVSGQAEKGQDIAEMTRRTMESLVATLTHLGLNLKDVVQIKSFVAPMSAVAEAEREIAAFFKAGMTIPPLVFVEWTTEPSIEIELIAGRENGPGSVDDSVEFITPPGMTASPVFSRVARIAAGPTIYVSGLYGDSQANGEAEIREIFAHLGKLLDKTGSDFRHLAKATYYVSTNEASTKLGTIRPEFYDPQRPPAASKAPVVGTGREGRTITLDMIAAPRRK